MKIAEAGIQVEIDRLVLRGLAMTPEQAQQLKLQVETELQELLKKKGINGSGNQEIAIVKTPTIESPETYDKHQLAHSLAVRIVESM